MKVRLYVCTLILPDQGLYFFSQAVPYGGAGDFCFRSLFTYLNILTFVEVLVP